MRVLKNIKNGERPPAQKASGPKGVRQMYKVQKKDGALEDFDRQKIVSGVVNAGASPEDAQKVADAIEAWLPEVARDNVINSMDIRTKGLDVLKTINPEVAAQFESYKKSEE
jgi:transcriptional regulator NrdR family protein